MLGRKLRLPAAIMTGPILLSAVAHLSGLTRTVPPDWAVTLTQLVVGTSLGARFVGLPRRTLLLALRLAALQRRGGAAAGDGLSRRCWRRWSANRRRPSSWPLRRAGWPR